MTEAIESLPWRSGLAVLAVVGLLCMHGLDGPASDLLQDPHPAHQDAGVAPIQGGLLLCAVVLAAAGLGLVIVSGRLEWGKRRWDVRMARTGSVCTLVPRGRRPSDLCVMRL